MKKILTLIGLLVILQQANAQSFIDCPPKLFCSTKSCTISEPASMIFYVNGSFPSAKDGISLDLIQANSFVRRTAGTTKYNNYCVYASISRQYQATIISKERYNYYGPASGSQYGWPSVLHEETANKCSEKGIKENKCTFVGRS